MLSIGVEGHVPRPRTGRDGRKQHRVRVECAGTWIEVPQIDLVGPEVDAKHMITVEVREDLMRVRPFLAVGIGTGPVADTLEVVGHIADRAVAVDPKDLKI